MAVEADKPYAISNYEGFLNADVDRYAGKWIALHEGKVVDSDVAFSGLIKRVTRKYDENRLTFTKIPSGHVAMY